jgi:transcription initiation factor TFIID subunit 6
MPADAAAEEYDHLPGASVSAIAETVGFDNLPDEVARALAPDVEYRLREVIQDACKFMRHSKRVQLSTEDVNSSLKMKKVEALYGFPANAPAIAFKEVPGHPDFFTQASKEIELKDILAMKLPRPPIAVNVVPHWLAVDGVQPLIPENPPPGPGENLRPDLEADIDVDERARAMFRAPVAPQDVGGPAAHAAANAAAAGAKRKAAGGAGEDGGVTGAGADGAAVVQPVVAHELSKELQLYFDRVTAVIRGGGAGEEAPMLRAALASLATDAGLHQLMPYLVQFVQTEVAKSLRRVLSHTGPHTTALARWTPILEDFISRRISPPTPRFQSRHTSTPFNSN